MLNFYLHYHTLNLKKKVVEEVPTDKQMLEWLGEKAEDLDFYEESDEWIIEEEEEIEMDSDFAITSKPNEKLLNMIMKIIELDIDILVVIL